MRAVGYCQDYVIVTRRKGWCGLRPGDKFTCETEATRFWYASDAFAKRDTDMLSAKTHSQPNMPGVRPGMKIKKSE